jgi:hypothetical protein
MALNLATLVRPRTAAIFARDPLTQGKLQAFLLKDAIVGTVPQDGRARLDLTKQVAETRSYTATRNPVERAVADNLIRNPRMVSVQGTFSANPIGSPFSPAAVALGSFGAAVRRDLKELDRLYEIADRREPVFLVCPNDNYPNVWITSISATHDGRHKVELALTFEEARIVSPLLTAGVFDVEAAGAQTEIDAGGQANETVEPPPGLTDDRIPTPF